MKISPLTPSPPLIFPIRTHFHLTSLGTTQIKQRFELRIYHPKARTRRVILQHKPERMGLSECLTGHPLPVRLCVRKRWQRRTSPCTAHRPSRLGNPHPRPGFDVPHHRSHGVDAVPEDLVAVGDALVLVVRVAVGADEIAGFDDDGVFGLDPGGPGVDVADLDGFGAHGPEHAADVVDLPGQGVTVCVATIEILTADGDADDPLVPVFMNGCQQGLFLCVEVSSVFGPDPYEESRPGFDSSGHGVGKSVAI